MADADEVLKIVVDEAALLANSGGSLEEITPLLNLARDAVFSEDGTMPDDDVRESGLHPSKLARLGLA